MTTVHLAEGRAPAHAMFSDLRDDVLAVLAMLIIASIGGVLMVHHQHATRAFHPTFSLAEMRQHVDARDELILDARNRGDYAIAHIPTAINLPIGEWETRSTELKATLREHRNRLVIVYCSDEWCGQAEDLQLALIDQGHVRVARFAGGFTAWKNAGLRAERSP